MIMFSKKTCVVLMTALALLGGGAAHADHVINGITAAPDWGVTYIYWSTYDPSGSGEAYYPPPDPPLLIDPGTVFEAASYPEGVNSTMSWNYAADGTHISAAGTLDSQVSDSAFNPPLNVWLDSQFNFGASFTVVTPEWVHLTASVNTTSGEPAVSVWLRGLGMLDGVNDAYFFQIGTSASYDQVMQLQPGRYSFDAIMDANDLHNSGGHDIASFTLGLDVIPTPEPISMVMLGCLGGGMALARKLRRKAA